MKTIFMKENNWTKAVNEMIEEYKKLKELVFHPILGCYTYREKKINWEEWECIKNEFMAAKKNITKN